MQNTKWLRLCWHLGCSDRLEKLHMGAYSCKARNMHSNRLSQTQRFLLEAAASMRIISVSLQNNWWLSAVKKRTKVQLDLCKGVKKSLANSKVTHEWHRLKIQTHCTPLQCKGCTLTKIIVVVALTTTKVTGRQESHHHTHHASIIQGESCGHFKR